MVTAVVQIGNSDNKLSQQQWNHFVREVDLAIGMFETKRHFRGGSPTEAPWQNYCFVSEVPQGEIPELKRRLGLLGNYFFQDSIAVVLGTTEFISAIT